MAQCSADRSWFSLASDLDRALGQHRDDRGAVAAADPQFVEVADRRELLTRLMSGAARTPSLPAVKPIARRSRSLMASREPGRFFLLRHRSTNWSHCLPEC